MSTQPAKPQPFEPVLWKRVPDHWAIELCDKAGRVVARIPAASQDDVMARLLAQEVATVMGWTERTAGVVPQ